MPLQQSKSTAGIWPPYEAFYIEAMLFNTRSALASIESIASTIQSLSEDETGDIFDRLDRRALLNEFQNIVVQAGALSRYFWPMTKAMIVTRRAPSNSGMR